MTQQDRIEILVMLRDIFKKAIHDDWTDDGIRLVRFNPETIVEEIEKLLAGRTDR